MQWICIDRWPGDPSSMSEHILPDDLSRWPKNPHELLGVPRNASERDIRRAYARLIRTYKPELFPEHFRRIRDAYESAKWSAPFLSAFDAADEEPAPADDAPAAEAGESTTSPTPAANSTSAGRTSPTPPWPKTRSFEEELEEAWDHAIDGDEARAYSALLELQKRHPGRVEIALRLYCLLDALPELDGRRPPCDFLVQGLLSAADDVGLRVAYRREIETHPAEALSDRFDRLLGKTDQPGLLTTYVRWRWDAAGRQERLDVIAADLPALRSRLAADYEEIWLRLLVSAAEELAWGKSAADFALLQECVSEANRLEHLHLRCADAFDRLEYLEQIGRERQSLLSNNELSTDLLKLLSRYSTRPFDEIRDELRTMLGQIVAKPLFWWSQFNQIDKSAPLVVSIFARMLETYKETIEVPDDPRNPEVLKDYAREFLDKHAAGKWHTESGLHALKPLILVLCMRELIHPDLIAEVAKARISKEDQALATHIAADRPLHCVYGAFYLGQV